MKVKSNLSPYYRVKYECICKRRGKKRAIIAKLLTFLWLKLSLDFFRSLNTLVQCTHFFFISSYFSRYALFSNKVIVLQL